MSSIMTLPDGTIVDLHTKLGNYHHLAWFLKDQGASSDLFSSLGALFPEEKKEEPNIHGLPTPLDV